MLDWIGDNPEAEMTELDEKKKEIESIINPIMRHMYTRSMDDYIDDTGDFGDDELQIHFR